MCEINYLFLPFSNIYAPSNQLSLSSTRWNNCRYLYSKPSIFLLFAKYIEQWSKSFFFLYDVYQAVYLCLIFLFILSLKEETLFKSKTLFKVKILLKDAIFWFRDNLEQVLLKIIIPSKLEISIKIYAKEYLMREKIFITVRFSFKMCSVVDKVLHFFKTLSENNILG